MMKNTNLAGGAGCAVCHLYIRAQAQTASATLAPTAGNTTGRVGHVHAEGRQGDPSRPNCRPGARRARLPHPREGRLQRTRRDECGRALQSVRQAALARLRRPTHHAGDMPMLQADASGNATLTADLAGESCSGAEPATSSASRSSCTRMPDDLQDAAHGQLRRARRPAASSASPDRVRWIAALAALALVAGCSGTPGKEDASAKKGLIGCDPPGAEERQHGARHHLLHADRRQGVGRGRILSTCSRTAQPFTFMQVAAAAPERRRARGPWNVPGNTDSAAHRRCARPRRRHGKAGRA